MKTVAFFHPNISFWWTGNNVNQIVLSWSTSKDLTDLLSMEQVALILQDDEIPDESHGPWNFIDLV